MSLIHCKRDPKTFLYKQTTKVSGVNQLTIQLHYDATFTLSPITILPDLCACKSIVNCKLFYICKNKPTFNLDSVLVVEDLPVGFIVCWL